MADTDDDTSDGADDSGNQGADLDPGSVCEREQFDLAAEPPSVMLVLDKSKSMSDERWLHEGQLVTRWSSLHAVVSELVTTYDTTIDFGATLFPAVAANDGSGYDSWCSVAETPDVAVAPSTSTAILAAMPGPDVAVKGATPTSAGMITALEHLATIDQGPRAVIMVTDGLANCAYEGDMLRYDEDLPGLVRQAFEGQGIPTYVVGIDIRDEWVDYAEANAHEVLDEVARVGGAARDDQTAYYPAQDESALLAAMDEIAAHIECTVTLGGPVPTDASFEVWVDDQSMPEIGDCASEDGWRFTDATQRSTIELCGAACDALRVHGQVEAQTCEGTTIVPVP
ncbi:vWA domain-containing protein [Paraliomyxa miuraensis]|uniref:vWA domain-containing protein n=1 Tax=Paraliomyxa miuraensis TaxID=376150 RepID=UPI00225A9654|nr:vWA domain-containing protein [Paraliomyxa miuraensis]